MTKEQEEAIEIFEGLKRNKEIIKDIDKDYFFTFAETIINLIQEQQKEIEIKQNRIQELEKALIDDNYKYRKEMRKKHKIIDLMAETISAITTDIPTIIKQFEEKYCEFINSDDDCCWKTDKSCKDCIKQYFENQTKM